MNRPPLGVSLRWLAAGLIGAGGVYLLARVPRGDWDWSAFPKLLGGLGALLTAVLCAAPELVGWALAPFSHLLDSILMPSETVVPPADLKLARFYGQSLRFGEAAEEYERILQYHPGHVEAHLEGIRAAGLAGDERLAKKFYLGAQKLLRAPEQRRGLDDLFAARHQPLEDTALEALPEGSETPDTQPH